MSIISTDDDFVNSLFCLKCSNVDWINQIYDIRNYKADLGLYA